MKKLNLLSLLLIFFILFIPVNSYSTEHSTESFPKINARHAIVLDRSSNRILYGKKENEKCKMASTTKILTAIIIIENCSLDDIVIISSKSASTGGSRLGLSKNNKISVKDLLYGLMLKSGNDSAVALAEYLCGSIKDFSDLMNKKAIQIRIKIKSL